MVGMSALVSTAKTTEGTMTELTLEQEINNLKEDLLQKRIKRLEEFSQQELGTVDKTEVAKEALLVVAELQLKLRLVELSYVEKDELRQQRYENEVENFYKRHRNLDRDKAYAILHSAILSIRNHRIDDATVEILKSKASKALSEIKYIT